MVYFHLLQARSGFGDRIVDLWAAITIARLRQPNAKIQFTWDQEGINFANYRSSYNSHLFTIPGCEFIQNPPEDIELPGSKKFNSGYKEQCCIKRLSNTVQIILRHGSHWGNSHPKQIYQDRRYYDLDPLLTVDDVVDCYRRVAASTRLNTQLNLPLGTDLAKHVGVHIRLNDKLVAKEKNYDMSTQTWSIIEARAKQHIEHCIETQQPLFICSDDQRYKAQLVKEIIARGGDVLVNQDDTHSLSHDYTALQDFFSLVECKRIIQMTKYSTFSIAAALISGKPFMNFYPNKANIRNRIYQWQDALPLLEFEPTDQD